MTLQRFEKTVCQMQVTGVATSDDAFGKNCNGIYTDSEGRARKSGPLEFFQIVHKNMHQAQYKTRVRPV
jgi:hypothetical protein